MISRDATFELLAKAPVKQTDVIVARQISDTYGYHDDTLVWKSSDLLMSVSIDAVGAFLGTATKKAIVKLLGIVDTASAGDIFQVRLGLYEMGVPDYTYNWTGTAGASSSTRLGVDGTTTNLITNPSIETDTSSWTTWPTGSITRDTTEHYFGSASAKFTAAASWDIFVTSWFTISPSTTYTFSAYVKSPIGYSMEIGIESYTLGNTYQDGVSTTFTGTGAWQRVSVTYTTQSDSDHATMFVRNGANGTGIHYIDGLQLEVGSVATDYFDGNTQDTGGFKYISQGYFIVDEIAYDYEAGSTTITMYDHMWTAQRTAYKNTAITSGFTFPATVLQLAGQMASMIGVKLMGGFWVLPNASYVIQADPYINISNATVQTVIQEIAEATGTSARISDTTLVFSKFEQAREAE